MDGHHIRQVTDVPLYVDEKTIGEFSGCLDKNGTRIFEGDIVVIGNIYDNPELLED